MNSPALGRRLFAGRKRETSPDAPARIMFYDRTCRGERYPLGLSHAWYAGGHLYTALGRFDAWHGVSTWTEALDWLSVACPGRPIDEIQFWAHGSWGGLWMDEDFIKIDVLEPGHALYDGFAALRERLAPGALWWFRCCDVFGTEVGHDFATRWTRFFNCRAAGHTYQIDVLQSGLHLLEPGAEPHWSPQEGVVQGLTHARNSHLLAPNTITFLHGAVPRAMR